METTETTSFVLWDQKHAKGSLSCTTGWCGATEGFFANMVPLQCPCGGVIHGVFDANAFFDSDGRLKYEEIRCDTCNEEYGGDSDELAELLKNQRPKKA